MAKLTVAQIKFMSRYCPKDAETRVVIDGKSLPVKSIMPVALEDGHYLMIEADTSEKPITVAGA